MPVIYVPRTFGGTLILNIITNPSNPSVTTTIAYGRDGKVVASARDSVTKATSRDGFVTAKGR